MTERNPEIGRSITTDGITTNYHDVGEGPPVLLIHGSGPAPRQQWVEAMAHPESDIRRIEHPILLVHGRDDR
jgi:pimeloyl-ACP methyl ester carboxylesterase